MNKLKVDSQILLGRRDALKSAALLATAMPITGFVDVPQASALPASFDALKPLGARVKPIRLRGIPSASRARAATPRGTESQTRRAFSCSRKFSLLLHRCALVAQRDGCWEFSIPQKGQPIVVCPAFEEGRFREQLRFPAEVRVWQEDESPSKLAAAAIADRGLRSGRIGVEEATMFTFYRSPAAGCARL